MRALRKTIQLYVEKGRFRQAADRESGCLASYSSHLTQCGSGSTEEIGTIYQQDGADLQAALDSFERAGDWYSGEDATACVYPSSFSSPPDTRYRTANACYKDVADIAGQLGQFDKAIEKFELVGANSLTSPLTRYSVKEYYFKAGLCQLAKGVRLPSTIS